MSAEPFNAAATESAMADLAAKDQALRQAGTSLLISALSAMTADERAQFKARRDRHERWMGPAGPVPPAAPPAAGAPPAK